MFCPKCGNQIPDGSVVCNFCGAPQQNLAATPSQPIQPIQPVTPQPAPKKKNNAVLIAIVAVLSVLVIVAGVFIAFPDILDGGKPTTTQSEKKKKSNKNNSSANSDDVDTSDDEQEATEALEETLDCLYDPDSDECIDILTKGKGLANDEAELYYYIYKSMLNYYSYEITDCEKDGDNYVFTVDINTVDFMSISDDWYDVAEMLEEDEEFIAEWDSLTELEQQEWFVTIIIYVLDNDEGDYDVG